MTIEELREGVLSAAKRRRPSQRDEAFGAEGYDEVVALGAEAVAPLAELAEHDQFEVRRAATRALRVLVRHVGRPGADEVRRAVTAALAAALEGATLDMLQRELLSLLSELAEDGEAPAIAARLADAALRDDARMALERIPGEASIAALQSALATADEGFKPALAQSLRVRGVETPGVACVKLVPAYPGKE